MESGMVLEFSAEDCKPMVEGDLLQDVKIEGHPLRQAGENFVV